MQDIRAIDDKLNEMTKAGKILDALEQFYDPECTSRRAISRCARDERPSTIT